VGQKEKEKGDQPLSPFNRGKGKEEEEKICRDSKPEKTKPGRIDFSRA